VKNLIVILLLSVVAMACGPKNQKPSAQYEQKKASLEDMERDSPLKFLKVAGSHRGNLINQTVVEGEITNNATLMSYKSIKLQISFLDKEGSLIEKQKELLDETVKPGATIEFKIKTSHVKGANSVNIDVIGAVADK